MQISVEIQSVESGGYMATAGNRVIAVGTKDAVGSGIKKWVVKELTASEGAS